MANALTRGIRRFELNRKFEDYESMKKYFSSYYKKGTTEIIFDGYQTLTDTAATLEPSEEDIKYIGADGMAYLSTLADDSDQDSKAVYVVYQSSDGVVHGPITHLLPKAAEATTMVEHALGDENLLDVVSACDGTKLILDLTTYNASVTGPDDLAGQYIVVYSGNQAGTAHLIVSNTAASPTICTIAVAAANTNIATDLIQIQEFGEVDFFRLRQMWSEKEAHDTKSILIGDVDMTNVYGCITRDVSFNSSPNYYARDAASARCFLGKVKVTCSHESTDAKAQGSEIQVTFTPKAENTDVEKAGDIVMNLVFQDTLDWEPCIELEPATDVSFKILQLDSTIVDDMYIQITYLEANIA